MAIEKHVKILFKHDAFEEESIEGAWAVPVDNGYILDNILFYAKEYSLGDKIEATQVEGKLYAGNLIEESGHSTVRILFSSPDSVAGTRNELKKMGCSSELSNYEKLVAVDIPPNVVYGEVREFLRHGEDNGDCEYQEACISSAHRKE